MWPGSFKLYSLLNCWPSPWRIYKRWGVFRNLWETRDIFNKAEEVNVKLDAREMSHIIEHIKGHIDSNSGITRDTIEAAIYKIKKPNHNKNNNLIYL